MAEFRAGTDVSTTGMYRCKYCGPDSHATMAVSVGYANATIALLARAEKVVKFFRSRQVFDSCPNCRQVGGDQTSWTLEKKTEHDEAQSSRQENVASATAKVTVQGVLILSRGTLIGQQALIEHIRREQEAEGYALSPTFQGKAFDDLAGKVDDMFFVVSRLNTVFEHLGKDLGSRAVEHKFEASNGNTGKYFVILDRAGAKTEPSPERTGANAPPIPRPPVKPMHQPVGTVPSGLPSRRTVYLASNLGDLLVPWLR